MSDIKLGVQLYTLRDHIKTYEDTDKTFAFVKNLGCDVVQISGIGPLSAEEKEELVKKYALDVCVTHTDFGRMAEETDKVIDEHKMINCDCIGIGSMPSLYRESLEDLKEFLEIANRISKKMKERGCVLSYHNHAFEYEKIDGDKTIMDILLEETDPSCFFFTPDIAWMHIAGKDPAAELARMKNRVKVVHFKDYKFVDEARVFTELSNGIMDLDKAYKACMELGIPYIVYEQDNGFEDSYVSTEISYKNLVAIAEKND